MERVTVVSSILFVLWTYKCVRQDTRVPAAKVFLLEGLKKYTQG
jgi:hypothetical protein